MKKINKAISAILCLSLLIVIIRVATFSSSAVTNILYQVCSGSVQDKINSIASVYPTDSYFTASGNVCYSDQSSDCQLSNIPSRGGLPSGATAANVTRDAWSCCAFARYVFYCTFGLAPESCGTVSSSNAKIGDYMNLGSHYAIYLGQDSTYWYVYDSNYTSPATNIVKYNRALRKSNFSSVQIHHASNYDTINNKFDENSPVDLGTEFYASISHLASWNHLTVEEDGNVDICHDTNRANQYWKFHRQYDGSYKIVSAYNGKCLDVQGGSQESGANVQVHNDNNTDAQRWYIYKQGNGYQLKPKCSDCVIEMNAWNFYQGVNLVVGTKDNSDAEIFAINWKDFNIIGTTDLNISQDNYGNVNFSWTPALCATNYNVKIWNGSSVQPGEAPINLWNVKDNNISLNLGSGTFTAYLESYNALGDYVQGQAKIFSVNVLDYIPAHTVIFNSHLYSIYNTPTSWENAKLVCEQMGGYLATITSTEEQNVIEELLNYGNLKYYHLGANNLTSSGNWEWVTNESFDYMNWAEGEPNNVLNIENYLSIFNIEAYKGKWNDTSNSAISGISNGFICEIEINFTPVAETIYNNHKYQLFDTSLSWEDAKEFCENSGGTLCIIQNAAEQEVIQELLSKGNKELYWLGACRKENDFLWLNGQTVNDGYTNYSSGEPNNFNGVENYLQISNGNDNTKYKWNDHRNMPNDTSYGFICKFENFIYQTILGDANSDGKVNLLDAVMAQKAALSITTLDEQGIANADMNGDGKITLFDAIAIQKLSLSL